MAIAEDIAAKRRHFLAHFDQRVVLRDLDWPSYERFLELVGDRPVRLTYSNGNLELMNPSPAHVKYKKRIGRMVEDLLLEWDMEFATGGSMTFKRGDLQRGLEPDDCFWIASEPLVRGKLEFDFTIDPPPELAIEFDISPSALDRAEIYARLGVRELWLYDGRTTRALTLDQQGQYVPCEYSLSFPTLKVSELTPFVQFGNPRETVRIRAFQDWVRTALPRPPSV